MDHKQFFESHIPEPWTIFGLRLKPFSLGHLVLLHRIESPFLSNEKRDLIDLLVAVKFCSMSYRDGLDFLAFIETPKGLRSIERWAEELCGTTAFLVRLGLRYSKPLDWAQRADMFRQYLEEGSQCPTIEFDDEGCADIHMPLLQIVKITLWTKLHLSEAELMDRPWGMCLHDYITLKAIEGQVDVVDGEMKEAAQARANELFRFHNPALFEEQ